MASKPPSLSGGMTHKFAMPPMFWQILHLVGWRRSSPSISATNGAPCLPTACSAILKSVTVVIPVIALMTVPSPKQKADRVSPTSGIDSSQMVCPCDPIRSMSLGATSCFAQNCMTASPNMMPSLTFSCDISDGVVCVSRSIVRTGFLIH